MVSISESIHIAICVCTYRRPEGLAALLEAVGRQRFARRRPPLLSVVIVDNEGSEQAKRLCDQFGRATAIPIRYLHEPMRGISYVRNRYLDEVVDDCDFIAMVDDDEIPDPDWIEQLLQAHEEAGADVVEGRVVPVFPDGAPDWIVEGRYFGWHHDLNNAHTAGQQGYPELDEARTNNVLVRSAVVRTLDLRFDPRFALSGGGDIVFFRAIRAAGHRIVYARDARVRDMIPLERTNLRWLWRRWYRVGVNTRFKRPIRRKSNPSLKRVVMWKWHSTGAAALATGLALLLGSSLRGALDMAHLAPGLKQIAHGLGQAASGIGIQYEQYREEDGADRSARGRPQRVTGS
jgi:succinoglycan biosynthesis protein ExoM